MPKKHKKMGSIPQKYGYCIDCADRKRKLVISSRCIYHYKRYRAKISIEKRKKREQIPAKTSDILHLRTRNQWYRDRGFELTGACAACGGPTCKGHPKFEKFSVAHIFPKAIFPSVELHNLNYIELCFWDNNCHGNYDNQGIETIVDTPAWPIMVKRFHVFEHLLSDEEKSKKFYKKFKKFADAHRDGIPEEIEDKEGSAGRV